MKMLDYVQLAHVRMGENLERSSELVAQLVDIFQSGSFDALRIVASGSSRHAADCARDYLQDALQMQVSVVTPEAFVDFEHTYPQRALNIAVSQSGYSTNTIAALDYMRAMIWLQLRSRQTSRHLSRNTLTSFLTTVWVSSRWTL